MPVIRRGALMPGWCELRMFANERLGPGQPLTLFGSSEPKDIAIVGRGMATILGQDLAEGSVVSLEGTTIVTGGPEGATVIRMSGHWEEEFGGLGLFSVTELENPGNAGDLVDYPKYTSFDAHYHDCDEYWIVFEGHGIAVSEGKMYEVGPGDCVATGIGHHHDFPRCREPVRAVFFETTLHGQRRRSHLWDHTHGVAQPQVDRV